MELDKELLESIKRGLKDIEEGNVEDFEDFVKSVVRGINQKPKRDFEEFLEELEIHV